MFWDASRYQNCINSDPISMDVGTDFRPFSERGRYAKSDYSITVFILFSDLRGPRNELKSELKCSIPNMMPQIVNMASLGLHFGVISGTCGGQFCVFFCWLENGDPWVPRQVG